MRRGHDLDRVVYEASAEPERLSWNPSKGK